MTQLTRDEIEAWRTELTSLCGENVNDELRTLCDLALKGLEADKLTKDREALLGALRMIAGLGKESLTVDRDGVFGHQKIARAAIAAAEATDQQTEKVA